MQKEEETSMTIGERIAKIRKENNLSQEAFGEALGVTRQAISKWEADANIPDVDKLMAMSRLYGVSVGYILGMEEETEQAAEDSTNGPEKTVDGDSSRLTEEQLRMVEEIVRQYIEALPKNDREDSKAERGAFANVEQTKPKKKRRLWRMLGIAAVIGLVIYFQNTIQSMKNQYQNLQNNLYNVQHALNNQSSNLSHQIKEILENQNDLLVDSGYEIAEYDLQAATVTLSMYAEPKTYAPGMKVYFGINSEGQELTTEGMAEGHRYHAQITCALTDNISMFVRVERDGVTETQIMDYLWGMLTSSAPDFGGDGSPLLWGDRIGIEMTRIQDVLMAWYYPEGGTKIGDAKVEEIYSVLYVNLQEYQVFELTPDEGKYIKNTDDSRIYYSAMMEVDIPLREGDTVTFTTRIIDTYGREFEQTDRHYVIQNGEFDIGDYPSMEDLQRGK